MQQLHVFRLRLSVVQLGLAARAYCKMVHAALSRRAVDGPCVSKLKQCSGPSWRRLFAVWRLGWPLKLWPVQTTARRAKNGSSQMRRPGPDT